MPRASMLYLIRHAKAEPGRPGLEDAERSLSREGREDTVLAGRGLRRLHVQLDVVLTSPLRRARETAQLLAAGIGAVVLPHPLLAPGSSADALELALLEYESTTGIALVGHEPDLGRLASFLLTRDPVRVQMPFQPGQVAAIEVGNLRTRTPGSLRWFLTQQQLAFIGG